MRSAESFFLPAKPFFDSQASSFVSGGQAYILSRQTGISPVFFVQEVTPEKIPAFFRIESQETSRPPEYRKNAYGLAEPGASEEGFFIELRMPRARTAAG